MSWRNLTTANMVEWEATRAAMSNPNSLLSQKVYHYLKQGRTLNGLF